MAYEGSCEDRLAIRELLEAYADAVTRYDVDSWASCWTDDAVWIMPDYPLVGEVSGKPAVVAMWVEAMKQFPGVLFQAWPGAIEIAEDRAEVRSWTSEVYEQGGVVKRDRGRYDDLCVKVDGKWLFQRRTFHNVHRT